MTHKEFRRLQSTLDQAGVLSNIIRIGTGKNRKYEVLINGSIERQYKTRRSAKNYIIRTYAHGTA